MTSYRDENDIIGAVRPNMKCLRRRHKIKDLLKRERRCLADPNYLTLKQNNKITSLMRSIALDWIFEVGYSVFEALKAKFCFQNYH